MRGRSTLRGLLTVAAALALGACAQMGPALVRAPAAAGSTIVVTDIDGTLTPTVWATDAVRAGAPEALGAYAKKGYTIVYLSTRVPWLQQELPLWLRDNGFPAGTLHVAQSAAERDDPRAYKRRVLEEYKAAGWKIAYAYGDSETDFAAYRDAAVPREHVFALQRANESSCRPGVYAACLKGWTEHLAALNRVPALGRLGEAR